ncbi:MAG: hypothetical protein V1916_01090 [Patescibacteria group bacterium]
MDGVKQQILTALTTAQLNAESLSLWQQVLNNLEPEQLEGIYRYVSTDPNGAVYLTDNLTRKAAALRSGDRAAMQKIFDEEVALGQRMMQP